MRTIMALFRIDEKYPSYSSGLSDNERILNAEVYAYDGHDSDRVGSVDNLLIDERDRIRYLVVETGFWVFGKKVLLPVSRCADDPERNRIYVMGLTKEHIQQLPEYTPETIVDARYEAQLQSVYLASANTTTAVDGEAPLETTPGQREVMPRQPAPTSTNGLYDMGDGQHRLRLYEERLVASKQRIKTGEVTVTKRIETEPASASVPIRKEKIIIEIESIMGATQVNLPGGSLPDGETTQIDIYGEQAVFCKESVVRQEITIRKEIDEEVVTAQETLRREMLEVQQNGAPNLQDRTSAEN